MGLAGGLATNGGGVPSVVASGVQIGPGGPTLTNSGGSLLLGGSSIILGNPMQVGVGGPTLQTAAGQRISSTTGFDSLGNGMAVAEGANAKQGIATLVAGTVTVANTSITANSRIFLTPQETGALTGIVRVSARVVGTSFTITSSVNTDTAQIAWEIFEPG